MNIKYKTFYIAKRNGTKRKIEQPDEKSMIYLKELLNEFYSCDELKPSYFAHAFMKGRSICTMAHQHFGKKYILKMDVKDFFNSITFEKFSKHVGFPKDMRIKIGHCFKGNNTQSYLAQGAPTSPFLSNTYMRSFDWKAAWYSSMFNVAYSRYADDLIISCDDINSEFWSCQKYIGELLKQYELKENYSKRKLMHQGKRMDVVGVVVNEKFQINRKTRRVIRAILHNAKGGKLDRHQKGLINFKNMVDKHDKDIPDSIAICTSIKVANKV